MNSEIFRSCDFFIILLYLILSIKTDPSYKSQDPERQKYESRSEHPPERLEKGVHTPTARKIQTLPNIAIMFIVYIIRQ